MRRGGIFHPNLLPASIASHHEVPGLGGGDNLYSKGSPQDFPRGSLNRILVIFHQHLSRAGTWSLFMFLIPAANASKNREWAAHASPHTALFQLRTDSPEISQLNKFSLK